MCSPWGLDAVTRTDVLIFGMQPSSASTSEIKVINETFTQGIINITIENTPLNVLDPNHPVFSTFSACLLLLSLAGILAPDADHNDASQTAT